MFRRFCSFCLFYLSTKDNSTMHFFNIFYLLILTISIVDGQALNQFSFSAKKTRRVAVVNLAKNNIKGMINFTQERFGAPVIIRGVINGLDKGKYLLNLHEGRDISAECTRLGPFLTSMEARFSIYRQNSGQLGYIESDANMKAVVYFTGRFLSLSGENNIIGRSLAVHVINAKNSRILLCGLITLIN